MTFSASVRTVWDTHVWGDASILEPVIRRELQSGGAIGADVDELYHGTTDRRINFFQCVTKSTEEIGISGIILRRAFVTVSYWKELRVNEDTFNAVNDRLEEIRTLVMSELGTDWRGSVDHFQLQQSEPQIVDVLIGSHRLWRAREQYVGELIADTI